MREQIEIVHGHQSTSILQHIVLMAAKAFGLKTVFTEHSLFGYNDFFAIHLNKLIKWSFRDLDAAICVSHACKDNFVLRAKFDPRKHSLYQMLLTAKNLLLIHQLGKWN